MHCKIKIIDFWSCKHQKLYDGIAELTKSINDTYPQLDEWLKKNFFPGLKDGSRKIVVAYAENNPDFPLGVSLLKDTDDEKKICCLFVREECRGHGIADRLVKKSCEALKTDKPLITVADRNLSQLQRLLDKNDFTFSYRKKGVYRASDTENYFNNQATEILKNNILPSLFAYKTKHGKE